MHSYLRAIGFGNLKNESEVNELLKKVFHDYTEKNCVKLDKNSAFIEYSKELGVPGAGNWMEMVFIRNIIFRTCGAMELQPEKIW